MALDAGEIRALVVQLGKAPDAKRMVDLLEVLNEGVEASEALLRETKVGVAVNKYRTHADPQVAQMAKRVIKKWKDVVSAEKKAKAKGGAGAAGAAAGTGTGTGATGAGAPVAAAAPSGATAKPKAEFIATKPRTPANDGVKVNFYDDSTRNGAITGIYTALGLDSTDSPQTILAVAKAIEEGMFTLCKAVDDTYRQKTRSLVMNLRNKKNPQLRSSILDGNLKPAKLVTMTSQELAPEALRKEMETLHQKNLFDAQGAVQKRAVTDRFTCGKCKKKEVSYYQMQTRSADEPLTTFCTCENCGNRWKFC